MSVQMRCSPGLADELHVDASQASGGRRYTGITAGVRCGTNARFAMLRGERVNARLS